MSVGSVKQTKRLKRTFQPNSLFNVWSNVTRFSAIYTFNQALMKLCTL